MKPRRAAVAAGCRAAVVAWLALTLGAPAVAPAGEAEQEDQPAPESAEELAGPFARAFREHVQASVLFPRLKERLKDLPPFFRDTSLALHFRSVFFDTWKLDDSHQEAWAAGGWLAYESGWLADTLQVGATLYTSQPLYAPDDRDGTQLLKPGQQGYGVVGQAYARLRAADHTVTLYRQALTLPYVNINDSRMTPNTFEGVVVQGRLPWLHYGVGYLTKMKPRDSDEFHPMSVVAGVPRATRASSQSARASRSARSRSARSSTSSPIPSASSTRRPSSRIVSRRTWACGSARSSPISAASARPG